MQSGFASPDVVLPEAIQVSEELSIKWPLFIVNSRSELTLLTLHLNTPHNTSLYFISLHASCASSSKTLMAEEFGKKKKDRKAKKAGGGAED